MTTKPETTTPATKTGAVELSDAQLENASGGRGETTLQDIVVSSIGKPINVSQMGDGSVKPAGH